MREEEGVEVENENLGSDAQTTNNAVTVDFSIDNTDEINSVNEVLEDIDMGADTVPNDDNNVIKEAEPSWRCNVVFIIFYILTVHVRFLVTSNIL